ncbi:MAG: Uncharacterized protein AUREO_022440 [Aureobasidium pullulans]|nr:MAG: Uncharacterized protein AUREO_022440 [Aureobasidium pullulans]
MSDLLSANATKRLAYVHNRYGIQKWGCKLHDMGWMKISPDGLMPAFYGYAIESSYWDVVYVRPSDGVAFE